MTEPDYGLPPILPAADLMKRLRGNKDLQKVVIDRVMRLNEVFRDHRVVTRCEFVDSLEKGFCLVVDYVDTQPETLKFVPLSFGVTYREDGQQTIDIFDKRTGK